MNKFVTILITLVLAGASVFAQSKNDAVVYIQGEKSIPFYVKMEGQMLDRFSTDYFIINNLAEGTTKFQILFQQNQYPTQNFVVNIPASGYRSFNLQKVSDKEFVLYDVTNHITLKNGNKSEEDVLATSQTEMNSILANARQSKNTNTTSSSNHTETSPIVVDSDIPPFTSSKHKKEKVKKVRDQEDQIPEFDMNIYSNKDRKSNPNWEEQVNDKVGKVSDKLDETFKRDKRNKQDEGRFIDDMTLNNSEVSNDKITKTKKRVTEEEIYNPNAKNSDLNATSIVSNTTNASNSGCNPMNEDQFDAFVATMLDKSDEEDRLSYIRKQGVKKCFTTEQVRIIGNGFVSQSSRFEVANVLKAKTSDVENYSKLESLFNTNFLKKKFKEEVLSN